jgi:hypothetical protein
MQRTSHNHALTIHFPNPVQASPFGFPITLTQLTVVSDGQKLIGQPLQNVFPIVEDDVTPEFLESINVQLSQIGLVLNKVPE